METKLEKEITGVIYKFENKINGKIYIGQSRCERTRYYKHIKDKKARYGIDYAIRHDGIENFDYSIIESFTSTNLDEINQWMDEKEIYYISYYDCISPKGYNYLSGGNHPEFSDDLKQRISESITGEKNGFYGKKHSEESRQKMSESAKKRKPNRKGCKQPQSAIEKTKEAHRIWWNTIKSDPEKLREYNQKRSNTLIETNKKKRYKPILYYYNNEFIKEYDDWKELVNDLPKISVYILNKKLKGIQTSQRYDLYKFEYKNNNPE